LRKKLQHHFYRWYNFHLKVLQNIKIFHWRYAYTAQNIRSRCNVWVQTWRAQLTASYTDMFRSVLIGSHSHHAFLLFLSLNIGPIMMKLQLIVRTLNIRAYFDESLPYCTRQDYVVTLVVANYNFHKRHTSHDVPISRYL